MAAVEHPMQALQHYLPEGSFERAVHYLHTHKVHLTVTRVRKSVLGDYRNAVTGKNHRISINGNLNKYAFLITLLHELAHLLAFEKFGNRIASHGNEWKTIYRRLLADFITTKIFPAEIENALRQSLQNPAASSCAEDGLIRVLKLYDTPKENFYFIEQLPAGSWFKTKEGKVYQKGVRLRKRYKCKEIKTGFVYLFSPVYEVERVE
ncbi:MAG: SprT-like domain-containing protein [Parafilimonas sp.]